MPVLRRRALAAALVLAADLALAGCGAGFPWLREKPAKPAAAAPAAPAATQPAAAAPAQTAPVPVMTVNEIAVAYVRLVLAFDQLDPGYVDAYYGPPAWRDLARKAGLDAAQIQHQAQQLMAALSSAAPEPIAADPKLPELRRRYLKNQLGSLSARAAMLRGQKFSFDDEARALYDVAPPDYNAAENEAALAQVRSLLPRGSGSLAQRYNRYVDGFAVPRARLERVMQAAIADARAGTRRHLSLPAGERFELSLVAGKPWSAYNWYQGGFSSRIQVNTDLPVTIDRVIQLASHEGYPGHHVYGGLLEQYLVRGRGWPEYQVYALYSPQSFVAEGSADFGVDLLYPWQQRRALEKKLFRLAGLSTRNLTDYDRVTAAAKLLAPATVEAARHYLDGDWTAVQTSAWLQEHTLASPERARQRIAFFDRYRSYIVNYAYGEQLVRQYVEAAGGTVPGSAEQWRAFGRLLTTPRVASSLD
ncbi:MAG: hypothetical protein ISP90_01190 [Nevskia sp.]|nr:hypothetical protein [Nevskia sp.]